MPKAKETVKDAASRYRVMNPNQIPKGVPILSWRESNWYEGDMLDPPPGMSVERILREGYIEEVEDG